MKQEIRFLDCIERDLKSRKKICIERGTFSAVCFVAGFSAILLTGKTSIPENESLFYFVMFAGVIIATVPFAFLARHVLNYVERKENKKDWNQITKIYSLEEEIPLEISTLMSHIKIYDDGLLSNLFIELLPEDYIKMKFTQGEESEKEVKIIYILADNTIVTEKFICFDNKKVKCLKQLLNMM